MEKKKYINMDMKSYAMILALVVIFGLFYVLSKGANATPVNINNLIMQNGYIIILATGMLLCVLTGNIDLGVGSVVALSAACAGKLVMEQGWSVPASWAVALGIGLVMGVFAAVFIAYLDIPPFVVTLATQLMGRGLTYTLLASKTVGPLPTSYTQVGAGFLPSIKVAFGSGQIDLLSVAVAVVATVCILLSELRTIKTNNKYGFPNITPWQMVVKNAIFIVLIWFIMTSLGRNNGIPLQLLIVGIIVAIYHFITSQTVAGRQIYALGGNQKAARLSGINTRRVFFWIYVNMGLLSAIAGIILSARQGAANPKMGDGVELDAIASCYIGGAAAAGGVGTVTGAVVGALVMGVLNNGMSMIGLPTDFQKVVKGAVLLGAVTFDVLSKRKKN